MSKSGDQDRKQTTKNCLNYNFGTKDGYNSEQKLMACRINQKQKLIIIRMRLILILINVFMNMTEINLG